MDESERIYIAPKGIKDRREPWFLVFLFLCIVGWLAVYGLYRLVHG